MMEVKGRSNNSWQADKKPYAVKPEEKSPVLGMKKQKRGVFRTLIRNCAAFEIDRYARLAWAPDSRFAEVILNGKGYRKLSLMQTDPSG